MISPADLREGIKLKMDMADMSFIQGNVNSILMGKSEDYDTVIDLILPYQPTDIKIGNYTIEYDGHAVNIQLQVLENADNDPIMINGKGFEFGLGTGVPSLPFKVFTDNKGEYPCVLATLVFPFRLGSWIDPSHEKSINYEEIQVTGPLDIREKVVALTVLNRLLKSEGLNIRFSPIRYELVTVFIELYYKKQNKEPLLIKLTALSSKTAFKDAVGNHFLKGFDRKQINESAEALIHVIKEKPIENEMDLLKVVESTISNVLIYYIENRRWIEAFWDGERTIKHNGEKILIPRNPKNETQIQPTLHVFLDVVLSPAGIHVIRESNEGIGHLDFRCLYTTKDSNGISVGIEFKLAHHKEIQKGIRNQLPAYLKAIRSNSGIFSVMWFKDQEEKYFNEPKGQQKNNTITWLNNEAQKVSNDNNMQIITSLIDASIKASASKI